MALREVGAVLGLGALGGVWAVAWGARRGQRVERSAMLDARTQVQVLRDALRARAAMLAQREAAPEVRAVIDDVVEQQVLVDALLSHAASVEDVRDVVPEISAALESLEGVAGAVGLRMPADRPYEGLCFADPAHGPPVGSDPGLCAECAAAAEAGAPPSRRMVSVVGRPVPFDTIDVLSPG
jgi:hypothetical protein